jgi:hypothetical protein
MSEEEEAQLPQTNTSRRPGPPAISHDYFSSVLASLNSQFLPQQTQSPSSTAAATAQPAASASTPQQSNQNRIERDYFQNIMQNLLNPNTNQPPTSSSQVQSSLTSQSTQQASRSSLSDEDLATKLELMHELGFFDDELNIRALQITEGNVEAAVSLIMESPENF